MLRTIHEQVLVGVDSIWELMHLEEGVANVAHYLKTNCLDVVRDLIQRHAVHLNGSGPLLLLEIDVAHVHTEAATERVLFVFHNLGVNCQCLVVIVVGLVLKQGSGRLRR